MAASLHGDTPYSGRRVTLVPVTPYTTSVDVNSPHRSEYFREVIGDWLDDPITDTVQALLPEWVRWNGEQVGLPAALIERAVSAAVPR